MGCTPSLLRRLFGRKNNEKPPPAFPRRITEDVFDYVEVTEPTISVSYRAQPYQPSSAVDFMNITHYHEVKRLFGQSPMPYPYQPPTYIPPTDPPEPVVRRILENKLEYKVVPQPSTRPVDAIQSTHKSTKYVVPIYYDSDSESDISVAELTMTVSQPVEIPGPVRKPTKYKFRAYSDICAADVVVTNNPIVSELSGSAVSDSNSLAVSGSNGSDLTGSSGTDLSGSSGTYASGSSDSDDSGSNQI